MTKPNPYNYNLPVQEEMFYGRAVDCNNIVARLISFPGDSVAVIGGRQMGKTSLLEAVLRTLEQLQDSDEADLIPIPILIRLNGEISDSPREFFYYVGKATKDTLRRWLGSDFLQIAEIPPQSPPAPILGRWLLEWSKLLTMQVGRRFRLILLLDECEQIVDQPWATDLYDSLHYLLTSQSTRTLMKIVMAGSHQFLTQVQQNGSPLREILHYHKLQVLDGEAIDLLITRPSEAQLSRGVTETIRDATGGHPFLIQYIMYHLWEFDLPQVTLLDVESIIKDFPRMRSNFSRWLKDLSESGSEVFYLLSIARHGLDEGEIRAALRNTPADLIQVLDALQYHGLIARGVAGRYKVCGFMFRDWFKLNRSQDYLKLYTTENRRGKAKMANQDFCDVFLSHSHSDADLVETLAERLEDTESLKVWFDKWTLIPGQPWVREMAQGISQAKACAVFLGENTPRGWFREEIERALNRQAADPTFRVIPVLLPGANASEVNNFLELRTWVDFRKGLDDKNAFRRLVSGIRGAAPGRDLP